MWSDRKEPPNFLENIMNEEWRPTNNKSTGGDTIIEVSNRGRIKRKNGTIEGSTLYKKVSINGKLMFIHRFIAKHFLPQTDEDITLGRNQVDHITHYPTDMNVNDVRNLRWATAKENSNFPEARENHSKAMLNKPKSEFGKKYFEHFGYCRNENTTQYTNEWKYHHRNGKCRWE